MYAYIWITLNKYFARYGTSTLLFGRLPLLIHPKWKKALFRSFALAGIHCSRRWKLMCGRNTNTSDFVYWCVISAMLLFFSFHTSLFSSFGQPDHLDKAITLIKWTILRNKSIALILERAASTAKNSLLCWASFRAPKRRFYINHKLTTNFAIYQTDSLNFGYILCSYANFD